LGFGAILTQVSRMVRQAVAQVKELDAAMTQIAVVTNFTTDQLWGQIDAYMTLAQQYGVTTTGVYQVSQLYYQQGLNTNEVMQMTTETLKMAKIAGLDYAAATDYMTVAIRGFKLGVEDAGRVVDVYSNLAAIAATDTRELAIAMSKTASIAESAGMSIESTASFLTLMIETTREAPENLGTAMKTIIARFQEMKKSPLEIVDVEGEEVSLNRVDKALQTVGISLTNASGQFKDLDQVILELSDKWDSLDRNTQRYIATTVAGSRQQSRFLALMSDNERLVELHAESLDSEDAALLQYAKTLDSIESKINQLSTSFQQFYMSILNGPVIGGVIDLFNELLKTLNKLPKIVSGPAMIVAIKLFGTLLTREITRIRVQLGLSTAQIPTFGNAMKTALFGIKPAAYVAKHALGGLTVQTNMLSAAMHGLRTAMGVIGIVLTAISIGSMIFDALGEDVEDLTQRVEDSKIKAAELKKEYKDLVAYEEKWNEAQKNKGNSAEAYKEWIDLNNEIADLYPELIARIDEEGNKIVALGEKYRDLRIEKEETAVAGAKTLYQDTFKLNIAELRKLEVPIEGLELLFESAQTIVND
jgi:TP901 family phage tail tape measure protein